MRYYIKAFKNYCTSDGRASRKEIWLFMVFHYLAVFILSFFDEIFGFYPSELPFEYGYMTIAYVLISICPWICLQIRRLHDINKSGNMWFLYSLPIICLYLYLKSGDSGINKYGSPPGGQQFYNNQEPIVQKYEPALEEHPVHYRSNVPETIPTHPQIRFCRKCGFELINGSTFCSRCGTAVVKE